MISNIFARAVRNAVEAWRGKNSAEAARDALNDPIALGRELTGGVHAELALQGINIADLSALAKNEAYIHLEGAFPVGELPNTPTSFCPVPCVEVTLLARASCIAALATLGFDTVSYGSENDGELFVNLVLMPGEGVFAEKSRSEMKGHTDAVSFPLRGKVDEQRPDLAPSPDFVCLAGIRNPENVQTMLMTLDDVLAKLKPAQIEELKRPQFGIRSQQTFREGMKRILGKEHVLDGAELLCDIDGQTWVRYSHRNTEIEDSDGPAASANHAFVEACKKSATGIIVAPGDILLVNNRLALHGRTSVGGEPGGDSRWIIRTYGLITEGLNDAQRYPGSSYRLFP